MNHLLKKLFFVLVISNFLQIAFTQIIEKDSKIDLLFSTGLNCLKLHELVFGKIESDLVWTQKPNFSLNAEINLYLKQGFTLFADVNFFPLGQNMFLTDSDFDNGFRWSYSEHPSICEDSYISSVGLGWKFFVKDFQTQKNINALFIEPALKCKFHTFNFFAYDGYADVIFDYHKQKATSTHYEFDGKVVEYKLRLFSTQLLLNFYGQIGRNFEIKTGLGIGVYSKALACDHHIERQTKFYDSFNFYMLLCSADFQLQYLINRGFGLFAGGDFSYCNSKHGGTLIYDYEEETKIKLPKGSSGLKFIKFKFSLGMFCRIQW